MNMRININACRVADCIFTRAKGIDIDVTKWKLMQSATSFQKNRKIVYLLISSFKALRQILETFLIDANILYIPKYIN